MNKKIFTVLLILILAVFITGCKEEEVEEEFEAFVGGSDGLVLEFIENAPPSEVFDFESMFDMSIKIENIGEWDIENPADLTITISGIDPSDFGKNLAFLSKDSAIPMAGKHPDPAGGVLQGTIDVIDFPGFQYTDTITGKADFNIRASACYEYGTKINSKICVLEDLIGITRRSGETPVCEPQGEKDVENSGAPVHVVSLTENVFSNDRIGITFRIQHVGTGAVYQTGSECGTELAKQNKVYARVNTGISGITCSGIAGGTTEGYVTLYNGQRDITCTTPQLPAARGDYEKPISIELRYGYREYIDKVLTVRHAGS
ncbi:hypothetical protein KY317_04215 [Candidatus Woesearchaeota archaeon]|nr:hypothetical protein [Candidatus Woesearchaeota archaeon]